MMYIYVYYGSVKDIFSNKSESLTSTIAIQIDAIKPNSLGVRWKIFEIF
jgi:hypothetical protein